jgi:hypothetical protein
MGEGILKTIVFKISSPLFSYDVFFNISSIKLKHTPSSHFMNMQICLLNRKLYVIQTKKIVVNK